MQKLKHAFFLIATFFMFSELTAQKDSSGIYKTSEDFMQNKLSYAINYKTEKHKINDDLLFHGAEIKVKHHGTNYSLKKSDTYGYRSTKGITYRFVDNKTYKILNPGEPLLIYVYQHPSHSPKEASRYTPMYFFSIDAASATQELNKANLKNAYPENHHFHDALDAQFKENKDLYAYDNFHKMYKLNRLLMQHKM